MHPESKKYLWDATEAGRQALQFAAGKNLGDYLSDALLRAGIERQLIILGESLRVFRSCPLITPKDAQRRPVVVANARHSPL